MGALVHTAAVLCFIWPKAVMNMNSGACWCHKKAEECSVLLREERKAMQQRVCF